MNALVINLRENGLGRVRATWDRHRATILRAAVGLLCLYAALKLGDEFRRLLFETSAFGANDLKILSDQTHAWFEGQLVYAGSNLAPHPPATFAILYPFLGWLDFAHARWVWAATTVVMLGALVVLAIRASDAETRLERGLVVLMLLSMNATGVTVGNGQLILHVLPVLLTGLLWLRAAEDARSDLLAGSLIAFALVKPSIAAPFLWLALFAPPRPRPLAILTIGVVYLGLTLAAISFQPTGLVSVLSTLVTRGSVFTNNWSYANLTTALADLGLIRWSLPASALVFALLGAWVYFNRRTDFWILLGVCAIVTRLGIYHLVYDDVLTFLPMLALFRIAKRDSVRNWSTLAGTLLAINIGAMLFLASWQFAAPPLNWIFGWGHSLVWIADLIFLMRTAARRKSATT